MRPSTVLASCFAALALGVVALADHHLKGEPGGDKLAWFDAEQCVICQPMAEAGDLLQSMKWESHNIDNGMVMVAIVDQGMVDKFHKVCEKMHNKAAKVAAGESPDAKCCGFCTAFGEVLQAGAKMQQVDTGFGQITIVTAEDPSVVKKIHAMSDKSQAEMKKMAAAAS